MENELTELADQDIERFMVPVKRKDIIDIILAYDISFIRNFGSDLFYVEMVDGEPLVPMNPNGPYPPGIEKLFDLMVGERMSMLSYKGEKLSVSYFPVDENSL
ncbi:hypothetical protein [Methanolobus sp. WCC4]|uniref:hypothetical protein n=1 Tax=Methanolobus sp. WCC4 TaxID=3125784 RepID=UPI0030F65B49